MQLGRLVGLIVGVCALVLAARPADACGAWKMADKEKRFEIRWLINSASITKGPRRVGAFYLDTESKQAPRVVAGKRVVLDVIEHTLRKRGKAIGALEAGTIRIGKKTYAVAFTNPSDYHGMPAWTLTVKRGDDVIIVSEQATALCAPMHQNPPMSEADQQDEIRRRVAFYLAWRDLGR